MSPLHTASDQYLHYSRYVRDGLMEVKVNMTNCERVLAGDFPLRIWAVTDVQAPDDNALPMDAEYDVLLASEAELLGRINDNGSTLYLGHLLHQGKMVTVLHSSFKGSIREGSVVIPGGRRDWYVYTAADHDYRFVSRKMMPQRPEMRRMRDLEILQALQGAGDNPTVPRLLTFYALFSGEDLAAQAATVLDQNDFAASPPSKMPGSAEFNWSLMFSCMASTEPEVIEQISSLADEICAYYNGKYDGWSADPIPS